MIQFPSLAGAPRNLTSWRTDPLAARATLAIAGPGEIEIRRTRGRALEHAALVNELHAWRERLAAPLQIFRPHVHLMLFDGPQCGCDAHDGREPMSLWLQNANYDFWDSRWSLERRCRHLQQVAPGLAAAALLWIDRASYFGIPVYTPYRALRSASWAWWRGEPDEKEVLAEYASESEAPNGKRATAEDLGIPTREWFDRLVPTWASVHEGALKRAGLERAARRRDQAGELAKAIQRLATEAQGMRKSRERFVAHDEGDEMRCAGFAATLRWNVKDPAPRAYDDYLQDFSNGGYGVEAAYCRYPVRDAGELRALFNHLESVFALARLVEEVIERIAERSHA